VSNWQSPTHSDTRPPDQRLTVRPKEAAEMLSLSQRTLSNLIKDGEIPSSKYKRVVLIRVDDLDAFIDRHSDTACKGARQQTDGGEV